MCVRVCACVCVCVLSYIMYDPCLHAFSQCVCVRVVEYRLKVSAHIFCQMADAPSSSKKARYQNECTRRTSCCCCFLSVSVCRRAVPTCFVESKRRSWVHILTLRKHVGTAFRQQSYGMNSLAGLMGRQQWISWISPWMIHHHHRHHHHSSIHPPPPSPAPFIHRHLHHHQRINHRHHHHRRHHQRINHRRHHQHHRHHQPQQHDRYNHYTRALHRAHLQVSRRGRGRLLRHRRAA